MALNFFFLQIAMDTQRSVGKLEGTIQHLTSVIATHTQKIDAINEDIHSAKGMGKAVLWMLGVIGALGLLLLSAILTVLLKHFNLI